MTRMTSIFRALRLAPLLAALATAACAEHLPPPSVPTSVAEVAAPQDPDAITLDATLGANVLASGKPASVVARIRVGTKVLPETKRGPVNVALVVDTSGSMAGKAIDDARAASLALIDSLSDDDWFSVVSFDSQEHLLLPAIKISKDTRAEARKKIEAMKATGTTNMAAGLQAGLSQLTSHLISNGVNRLVLVGDGVPNDKGPMLGIAQQAKAYGVTITALGLGLEYDETLMGQIAQQSGGRFHYVSDSSKVAAYFKEEVLRLQRVYARGTSVTLRPGPGVQIEEVVGLPFARSGTSVSVQLGDLSQGDERDVIVRLLVEGRKAGANVEIADAYVTFSDALNGAGQLQRTAFLGAQSSADDAEVAKGRNTEVELSAALIEAAATTVSALDIARAGDPNRARDMLEKGAAKARAQAKRTPSEKLEKQAADMVALASDLPKPPPAAKVTLQKPLQPPPSPPPLGPAGGGPQPTMATPAMAHPSPMVDLPEPAARRVREAHGAAMEALQ